MFRRARRIIPQIKYKKKREKNECHILVGLEVVRYVQYRGRTDVREHEHTYITIHMPSNGTARDAQHMWFYGPFHFSSALLVLVAGRARLRMPAKMVFPMNAYKIQGLPTMTTICVQQVVVTFHVCRAVDGFLPPPIT